MRQVYFDHAATTAMRTEVVEAMLPYMVNAGNASSLHTFGQRAKRALEEARRRVAHLLHCRPSEVYFTSGGTESDNLAIKGYARANAHRGRHVITSAIEHHAILHSCEALEKEVFEVTYLPVSSHGIVDVDAFAASLRPDTILVSIMLVNNEVGTVQPIGEMAALVEGRGAALHCDAVQAATKIPIDVDSLGVDLLSLTAHKFHGPKGIGVLYVRRGSSIAPLLHGGQQEGALRPGTENIPGAVGLATALELGYAEMEAEMARQAVLRDRLFAGLKAQIKGVYLNGDTERRVASVLNMSFDGVDGETLLLALDMQGIAVSTGSACTAGSSDPSHVLLAMGVPSRLAQASLRFSLGRENTDEDVDYVLGVLPEIVTKLRENTVVSAAARGAR